MIWASTGATGNWLLTVTSVLLISCLSVGKAMGEAMGEEDGRKKRQPNILFVLTDDHRWDSYNAAGIREIHTPNLDRIAAHGTRFENAFVTLAICSPSRAACLTGRYGSANGVTSVGHVALNEGERTFAQALRDAGYATGVAGKWHLKTTPEACGFEFASTCWSNGTWYDRKFTVEGESKIMPGFVDDVAVDESIRFIQHSQAEGRPFLLWLCTQVPHMDGNFSWPAKEEFLREYSVDQTPLPETWNDDLEKKPEYLKTARNRVQALEYGYDDPENIRRHTRDYLASVQQMDASVGRLLDELERLKLHENTWLIFMGDNGWFLGEHGMTSKVLPYEESMRVPMAIAGPATVTRVAHDLVLNIDLTATIYELAGLPLPESLHGRSLLPILSTDTPPDWRSSFLYEAPTQQLGSRPLWAVRDHRWKYVETWTGKRSEEVFGELYDLQSDPIERYNLAGDDQYRAMTAEWSRQLHWHRERIQPVATTVADPDRIFAEADEAESVIPTTPPKTPRTDLQISGIYPHLTTYGIYSQNGAHYLEGHNECGIGAVVPWAGKLWMVNYAPHQPRGSDHKLFSVDPDLEQPLTVHPESVGGTPAGRMLHAESNQLLIGHHLIDADGNVRSISPEVMPMRVTAIARHLKDPANLVYYIDMEGAIWEANVYTLKVSRLFQKPVPGWHGKGGYTGQGRLVVSNNGEHAAGTYDALLVGGPAKEGSEEAGVLAEWDGTTWQIIERRQFTDVTGPNGIAGGGDDRQPIWAIGWDRRSLRLKLREEDQWHTYLLPKATYNNDARHGWYTEWPRIREITDGRWMMDMHGMFFDFPQTFSLSKSAGIRPIGSHLRYVPDFCAWQGQLILATDETSIQGNRLAGQPQSNLWFGSYEDLKTWGPATGYGGPWVDDQVAANTPSDPFLIAGFDRRVVHLANGRIKREATRALRTTDQQTIAAMPRELADLTRVTVNRGDWHTPAAGFEFEVDQPVTVYLAVDRRGSPKLSRLWNTTDFSVTWGKNFKDRIYSREFPGGRVSIPANATEHLPGSYGMPHLAFVKSKTEDAVTVTPLGDASVTYPTSAVRLLEGDAPPVNFRFQVDYQGDGRWADLETVEVSAGGNVSRQLPEDLDAVWLRLITDRNCIATAFLHQTSARYADGNAPDNRELFAGLADVDDAHPLTARLYAAKRNRNLRVIADQDRYFDFTKSDFEFESDVPDEKLKSLLHVEPEFRVDDASVCLNYQGQTLRLPKGDAAFDLPFGSGWPRGSREVESERHLANIHGTFYELPLITNGAPPAWNLMRPIASHSRQITDFCSWNGLLVLAGVRADAKRDTHVFRDETHDVALWFGGIDDLWRLGKPVGTGGPWYETDVKAGVPSDPYLMTGYDEKSIELSHHAPHAVTIQLQVDIDGSGRWVDYLPINVPSGQGVTHRFPVGFSANWIRAISDQDTTATVTLAYR